ncbi:discoidin domain-containing protein [uncultured Paraglaciecola sp.]|uniref:discoidin domain-containing protein n=1 Tax=uncultured Paraglaciecola sp. TaxID=1765024 RepID=UPI0026145379|nr:discoidin domain-containing protein [uncultured Paraglaciecola sp.]
MSSLQILDTEFVQPFLSDNGFHMFKGLTSKTPLLIESDIQSRFVRLQLSGIAILNLDKVLIESADGKNLLEGADIMVSSSFENQARFDGKRLISGRPTGGVNYHSDRELNPWIVIDLKQIKKIAKIEVYNRNDRFFIRALTMVVSCSNDLQSWSIMHDNFAYKLSEAYLALNQQQKALVDCASMNVTSINELISQSEKNSDKDTALKTL